MCAHIHIPVCGEPGARWAGLVPLLSSPLIGSQLVAGGLERVLRMEVGVVRLVLTTSCGESEEGGERREEGGGRGKKERRESNEVGRRRMGDIKSRMYDTHLSW